MLFRSMDCLSGQRQFLCIGHRREVDVYLVLRSNHFIELRQKDFQVADSVQRGVVRGEVVSVGNAMCISMPSIF